jgi:hypothetical protein
MLRQLLQPFTHHFQALKSKVMRWNKRGQRFQGVTKPPVGTNATASVSAAAALSASSYSPTVSAISDTEDLTWGSVPAPITLVQGGSFDLAPYVSGGEEPFTFSSGSLPSGVTLSAAGLLEATVGATVAESGDIQFHVDDSADPNITVIPATKAINVNRYTPVVATTGPVLVAPAAKAINVNKLTPTVTDGSVDTLDVDFGVVSAVGGSNLPFVFGHTFAEGAVPASSYVTSDLTDFQAVPTTYWPDNSVRHAIIAGRASCTANVPTTTTLSTTTSAPGGTNLTTANLKSVLSGVSLSITGLQDWTFDTAAQTVGALLDKSSSLDEYNATSAITVNNSASSGSFSNTPSGSTGHILTASISGGTTGARQTVTCTLRYHRIRTISAITKAANARITYVGDSMEFSVGDTVTFAGVGGMTEMNSLTGTITDASNGTNGWFEVNINSTSFTTFTSGGTARRTQTDSSARNIIAYVRTGGGLEWNGTANVFKASNSIANETLDISDTDFDSPRRVVCAGPVMSNWLYRQPCVNNSNLVLWIDVRLFVGGNFEVFPWIENVNIFAGLPTRFQGTFALSVDGSSVFSQVVYVAARSRIPLITGRCEGYWSSDPQITPVFDVAYLRDSKMFPNYGWRNVDTTTLNALDTTYSPNSLAEIDSAMGSAGTSASILNREQVIFMGSGDVRAWKAGLHHDLSGGSWSIHYRVEEGATGLDFEPLVFTDYPNASLQVQDTPVIPTNAGEENGVPTISHQPAYGYFGWLLTGRWWYLDEMLFWGGWNYLWQTVANRSGSAGVIRSNSGANTDRGAAWGLRSVAQTLVCVPSTHSNYADRKASWEANMAHYYGIITGSGTDNEAPNNLGIFPFYGSFSSSTYGTANSGSVYWGASWMQHMIVIALGYSWDLKLPQSGTSQTHHAAIRDFGYLHPVGHAGDGQDGRWSYRSFATFAGPFGPIGGPFYTAWSGDAWTAYKGGFGLTVNTDPNPAVHETLYQHSSTNALAEGTTSVLYGGMALMALTYAKDHGATGAEAAYDRVSQAPNFSAFQGSTINNDPAFNTVPRT